MNIMAIIYLISCPMFLLSLAAHFYVKIKLRPGKDSGIDDYYHEFEHQHPDMMRYATWSKITFISTAFCSLILFLATAI